MDTLRNDSIFAVVICLLKMKKLFLIIITFILILVLGYNYLAYRWLHLWEMEPPRPNYSIKRIKGADSDTLKIVMIGDSWAGMHNDILNDSLVQLMMKNIVNREVSFKSIGKGGETSRGVYLLLFDDSKDGTKPILKNGANYCIVIAGINDAGSNLGTQQYLYHMKLIINFLISNGIRPVLVEIPDVNIWNVYRKKPIKDLTSDYLRSCMTGCEMYSYKEYRDSLASYVNQKIVMNSIIYVRMRGWNGDGVKINENLFQKDQVHLNRIGYKLLDSCIITAISNDLKQSVHPEDFY